MRDHYGLAQRASDDGTLMKCTIQAAVPKLSLGEPQPEELEQELGQPPRRRPSSSLGRACPSSCLGASAPTARTGRGAADK